MATFFRVELKSNYFIFFYVTCKGELELQISVSRPKTSTRDINPFNNKN